MRKLSGAVSAVGDAADATDQAVDAAGKSVESTGRTAAQVLRSVSTKSEALADSQIATIEQTKSELKELKSTGQITADEYTRAFANAERKIKAINDSIGRDTRKTAQKIADSFNNIGKGLVGIGKRATLAAGAAAASAGAAGGAVVAGASERAQTLQIGAQVAGLDQSEEDFKRFQRFAAAIRDVGFDAEKAGDILKDMNDRLGDVKLTGAGPLVDVIETTFVDLGLVSKDVIGDADKIKAAAKKLFTGSDSLEVLQDIVARVTQSGGGIQELAFVMEGMAGDATRLVPLLENSASELNRLGQAAEDSGSFMTLEDLENLREFREAATGLGDSFKALGLEILRAGALDVIKDLFAQIQKGVEWVRDRASPEMLKWGSAIAALVVAIGPIIAILGVMILAAGPAIAIFGAIAAKVALFSAVVLGFAIAIDKTVGYIKSAWNFITDMVPDWAARKLGIGGSSSTIKAPKSFGPSTPAAPVNIAIDGTTFTDIGGNPDAAKSLQRHMNQKAALRPTSTPRTFR
jgi:hypothetical protein